jgi:DNA-binding SARP family transcriptional activator/DNA-binding XRE family transcriptional regulator
MAMEPASATDETLPGDLVRYFRRRASLSQSELARLSGVSIRTMRDIEQGRVHHPRATSLDRLAAPLRLSQAECERLRRVFNAVSERADDRVRLGILGPIFAYRGGRPQPLGQPLQRTLLGLLTLRHNERVGTDEIVDVIWGEHPPRTCRRQVQAMVGRLRHLLAHAPHDPTDATVRRGSESYLLEVDPELVDAGRFERFLQAARQSIPDDEPALALGAWQAAIRCWRGPVLVGTNDRLRLHPRSMTLSRHRVEAVLGYADAASALGRHGDAIDALRDLGQAEPLHEGLHARLVLALARDGDRAGALWHYESVRQRLMDELGVTPGHQLRRAHLAVLTRGEDPSHHAVTHRET